MNMISFVVFVTPAAVMAEPIMEVVADAELCYWLAFRHSTLGRMECIF